MGEILLQDLLKLSTDDSENAKIRFMQHNGAEEPMDVYINNPELVNNRWLFWRTTQRYFNVGQIALGLLKLSKDTWLLTTIKRVTEELNLTDGINYRGEEIDEYSSLFGRVIIKYKKRHTSQGVFYNGYADRLVVQQILPNVYDGDAFPGYDNVKLSFAQLENILSRGKRDWINALKSQKAVYLITDLNNGKLYVGSATSANGMLLSRWENYIKNGHGGNIELKTIVEQNGFDYIKTNFQYALLENYNSRVDDLYILERESWWKNVLQSRKFGYNLN